MNSNAIRLLELASETKSNCNVMRSYDWSYDEFYLIGTISYHKLSGGQPLINHLSPNLSNFFGQLFESTF